MRYVGMRNVGLDLREFTGVKARCMAVVVYMGQRWKWFLNRKSNYSYLILNKSKIKKKVMLIYVPICFSL